MCVKVEVSVKIRACSPKLASQMLTPATYPVQIVCHLLKHFKTLHLHFMSGVILFVFLLISCYFPIFLIPHYAIVYFLLSHIIMPKPTLMHKSMWGLQGRVRTSQETFQLVGMTPDVWICVGVSPVTLIALSSTVGQALKEKFQFCQTLVYIISLKPFCNLKKFCSVCSQQCFSIIDRNVQFLPNNYDNRISSLHLLDVCYNLHFTSQASSARFSNLLSTLVTCLQAVLHAGG